MLVCSPPFEFFLVSQDTKDDLLLADDLFHLGFVNPVVVLCLFQ